MKNLILIFVVLLLLAGGGRAAYYFFLAPPEEKNEEAREEKSLAEPLETLPLGLLPVPVIRKGAVVKYVVIRIELELMADVSSTQISRAEPRLRDSCLRALYDYFASVPVDSPVNIRTVKKRLMRAVEDVLGKNSISDILIQGVYEKKD